MFNTKTQRRKVIIMVIMFMVAISAFCVPARRVWRTVIMADGTEKRVMTIGDEHGHWMVDAQGKALRMNQSGRAYYISNTELSTLKTHRTERMNKINAKRVAHMETMRTKSANSAPRKTFGEPTAIYGSKKGIVILVNYADTTFKAENTREVFDKRFNQVGYNAPGYIGSVHDYFYDQSYGKFDLTFDVVGPVTVSKKHDYYGANNSNGNDKYPATMVIDALKLADDMGVDFSKYDWNGDGEVEQVFVIYAGTGENASDIANDIWPHEYELSSAKQDGDGSGAQTIDGVKIDTYACSCELADKNTIDGIGTACHEFSHCLGYADLYDTDYSGGQGMMYWDLLDGGSYNGPAKNGEVPAAYTSFERWWAGWLTPTILSEPQSIADMPALGDEAVAYKIINDAHPDEYYLLENRQAKRWDSYTAGDGDGTGHGMMILYVDYDKDAWTDNAPNDDPGHQRMTYFPADNNYGTYYPDNGLWGASYAQRAGDPFPGTNGNTAFTDDTTPAATIYNTNPDGDNFMNKPITDITEKDGKISFTFMGGIASPESIDATNITSNSFTANWNAVEGADRYDLELKDLDSSTKTLFSEDFSKCNGSADGSTTTIKIDNYVSTKGWTVSCAYLSTQRVKIGTATSVGYITTPLIAKPSSGSITMKLKLATFKSVKGNAAPDETTVAIDLINSSGTTLDYDYITPTVTPTEYILNFDKITEDYKVKISSSGKKERFFLSGIEITSDETSAKIITGITTTNYDATNLTEGGTYKYRVRSVSGGHTSAWSKYITVNLTPTGIISINAVSTGTGNRYYNLQGQAINKDALRHGSIYILGGKKYTKR